MTAVSVTPADLVPFADIPADKAAAMIADALGMAKAVAPCILQDDFAYPDAAKAIIRGAILRWFAADSGAVTTQQAGPYQQVIDSNTRRNGLYWPSEIAQLQALCGTSASSYSLSLSGADSSVSGWWSGPDTWTPA